MTAPRFLQIHTLHSYPAALLNRDDSGLAKRLPFGGAVRTRISSQCLQAALACGGGRVEPITSCSMKAGCVSAQRNSC